ncbi:MAG: Holliday junction resolvase RuvX [Acidobacteriota bacterium]
MRALGIDFGERRIGLAITAVGGRLALPLETFVRETDRRAVYRIAALVRDEGVTHIVLGEPRGLEDGAAGAAAERIRRFGAKLAKAAKRPIHYVDEALSTVEAAERLRDAGLDRPDREERRDAVAAQNLLQQALEHGALPVDAPGLGSPPAGAPVDGPVDGRRPADAGRS